MRRFFTVLFLVSLVATGAAYYWRTFQPEGTLVAAQEPAPMAEDSADGADKRSFSPRSSGGPEALSRESSRFTMKEPSERQDMAMMISLVSSVISAIAAIFQTWLTARSVRVR